MIKIGTRVQNIIDTDPQIASGVVTHIEPGVLYDYVRYLTPTGLHVTVSRAAVREVPPESGVFPCPTPK